MGYRETGIVEVVCTAGDGGKVVYKNRKKMQLYQIPEGYKTVSYISGKRAWEYEASLLKKIKENAPIESDQEKEQEEEIRRTGIEFEFDESIPKAVYTDVTESEMFGFPEISKNVLTSPDNGIWAYQGMRKLKFTLSQLVERDDDRKITAVLYFNRKDNDEIPDIRMEEIRENKRSVEKDDREYELYVFVDTNKLGKEFDQEKQKLLFSGYLEISFVCDSSDMNHITYCFPVELLVNNTNYDPRKTLCTPLQKKVVSIDFGTSSSCVAVEGENGIELLTLSATETGRDDINIYENPTCVMIYRWKEIYKQWKKENTDYFPFILKGDLDEEEREEKEVQFDFGYSVKACLDAVSDRELNAILTEIKMIPKMMAEGLQPTVRPLIHQDKKTIRLVDSYEGQDEEKLDIVAFYGYILGRAINRVDKNRIYTKFQITYPVKFNNVVRKKMCSSLEYGLKRALPLPLRDAVDKKEKPLFRIETKYAEPVAYIGSVCGKYLTIDKDTPAKLFAVYDFGGGTLDYSFGIFAQDPEDPNSSNIYILGVDGDSDIGGELLIRKLSYWVYTSSMNVKQFVNNRIPFEKPSGEILPDECPEELFNQTASAKSNVKKMNERITRKIFECRETAGMDRRANGLLGDVSSFMIPQDARKKTTTGKTAESKGTMASMGSSSGMESIVFLNLDEEECTIRDVSFDEKELNNKLRELLCDTVKNFKDSMQRTFESKGEALKECGIMEFRLEDVYIFKAGNSSRNKILEKIMEEEFQGNEILLVDETSDEFMSGWTNKDGEILGSRPKQVALTPKTAVAFGQLKLSDYQVIDSYIQKGESNAPFNWYIGVINRGNNSFEMLIDKVNPQKGWVRYGRINSEETRVYYSETLIKDADDTKLRSVVIDDIDEDDIHKYLYVRIQDADEISCCVCARGETPDDAPQTFNVYL